MCALRIDEQELVPVLGVLEIPVDPLVLEQPRDEVEVAFAVLHAIDPLAIRPKGLELELRDAVILEHRLDDVWHRLVLEDAAVGGSRQEPEPGIDGRLVGEITAAMDTR